MTFPTIPTGGRVLTGVQTGTTATRTFPDISTLTKSSGDLLVAIVFAYQTTTASGSVWSSWTAGWTEFADLGGSTNGSIGAAYKFSTGSETGTIAVTQAATITGDAGFIYLSIAGAHASAPPESGGLSQSSADAGSITPSWGALDTLWIAAMVNGETSLTGTFDGVTVAPTNYTNLATHAITQDAIGGCQGAVAFRQLNAASEDPGAFTADAAQARSTAITMAVRPAPSAAAKPKQINYQSAVNRSYTW